MGGEHLWRGALLGGDVFGELRGGLAEGAIGVLAASEKVDEILGLADSADPDSVGGDHD